MQIENYIDEGFLHYENSIGNSNKQQFFGELEQQMISRGFIVEDHLTTHLLTLANLTCAVITDDMVKLRRLQYDNTTKFKKSLNQWSFIWDTLKDSRWNDYNPRQNSQLPQLLKFCTLLFSTQSSTESKAPYANFCQTQGGSTSPICTGSDKNQKNLKGKIDYNQQAINQEIADNLMRKQLFEQLKQAINLNITIIQLEKISMFVLENYNSSLQQNEKRSQQEKDLLQTEIKDDFTALSQPKNVLISYKYYKTRHNDIQGSFNFVEEEIKQSISQKNSIFQFFGHQNFCKLKENTTKRINYNSQQKTKLDWRTEFECKANQIQDTIYNYSLIQNISPYENYQNLNEIYNEKINQVHKNFGECKKDFVFFQQPMINKVCYQTSEICKNFDPVTFTPNVKFTYKGFQESLTSSSALMNHPELNVFEYPIEEIERSESRRIFEKVRNMKSLHFHFNIFQQIKTIVSQDKLKTKKSFSQLFYTFDEPKEIERLADGILPKDINKLSQGNPVKYFYEKIIEFDELDFVIKDKLELLRTHIVKFKIINRKPIRITDQVDKYSLAIQNSIVIRSITSSSPDADVILSEAKTFPLMLAPEDSIEVSLMINAENIGKYEALIYFIFDESILVQKIQADVLPNRFGVQPIYLHHYHALSQLNIPIVIANPYIENIYVDEIYTTNSNFKAQFIKQRVNSNTNITVANLVYDVPQTDQAMQQTMFSLKLRKQKSSKKKYDFIRIPIYLMVDSVLIEFKPRIIDFGLVQLNQSPMVIPISIKFSKKNIKRVVDYFLPTNQPNLDFQLVDPFNIQEVIDQSPADCTQRLKKIERLKRRLNNCLEESKDSDLIEFNIGLVYIKPSNTQFISTKIRLKLELHTKPFQSQKNQKDNKQSFPQDNEVFLINKRISWNKNIEPVIPTQKTECGNETQSFIFIDLPIIGSIVNHSAFISSSLIPEYSNHPLPLLTVKLNQTNMKTEAPLVLKNNLATSNLKIQRIIAKNSYQGFLDNLQFQYKSNKLQLLVKKGKFILEPNGQSMDYGKLIYDDYKSQKQIWMIINNVIVPQKAIFYQDQLQCQWLPNQEDFQDDDYQKFTIFLDPNQQKQILNLGSDHGIGQNEAVKYSYYSCQELPTLDFKQVQQNFSKSQILRITNVNPVRINLENLIKKQTDQIKVELIKTRDYQGRQTKAQWRGDQLISEIKGDNGIEYELINNKRTQKYIGLFIEPFQSMDFRITVSPFTKTHISSTISFSYTNQFSQNLEIFTIYYQYQLVDALVTIKPQELDFTKIADQRKLITKMIEISGPEDYSVHLKRITLNDQRFSLKFIYQDIMNYMTIPIIHVTYDSSFALFEPIIAKMIYKIQNIQNKISLKYTKLYNQSDFNLISNHGRLDFNKNIQPSDLRSARYYQNKKEMILKDQINKNSYIEIETSVGQILNLPLKGQIQFPRLSKQLELNFGKVQIGNQTMQDLNFTNPTDQVIEFQLFLGFDIDEVRLSYLNQINQNENEIFDFLSQKIKEYIIAESLNTIVNGSQINFSTDGIQNYCSLIFSESFEKNYEFKQFISDQNKKYSFKHTQQGYQKSNLQDLYLSDEIDGGMNQNYICLVALELYRNIYPQINQSNAQLEEKMNEKDSMEHFFNLAYNITNNIDYAVNSCIMYQCGIQQAFDNVYKQFLNTFEVQILSKENIDLIQKASQSLYEIYEWSIETKKILSSNKGFIDKSDYEKILQIDNFESNLINLQSTITPLSIRENDQAFLYSQFDKVKEIQKVYDKIQNKDFKEIIDNQEEDSEAQEGISLSETLVQKQNDSLYQKFINYLHKSFIQTYDFMNYMVNYDYYMKRKELLKEVSGQINNLGNFENRFKLKNQEIFQEMIRISTHGLRQQQQYQNLNLNILYPSKLGYEQINKRRKGKRNKYDPDEIAIQNFYLNPIYRQKVFTIPPKSDLVVENAIIFQPRSIEFNKTNFSGDLDNLEIQEQKAQKMRVIIKNSLTGIEFIDLNGQGTTAFMEVIDLQKIYEDYSLIDFPHHGRNQFNRRLKKISVVDSGFYNLSKNAPSWFQTNFFEYDSFKSFQYANNRYQFLKTGLTYFSINEKHLMIQGNSDSEELSPVDELGQYYEIYQDFRKRNVEKDAFVLFSLFEQYLRPYNKLLQPQFSYLFGKKSEKSAQLFLNQKSHAGQQVFQYINMNDDKDDGDIINERNNRRKPNFMDRIINKSLNRTTFYEVNQQIAQGMRSQTFMNFIMINIPLSDIVRRKMGGDILSYNHEMPTHPDDYPMHFPQFRNRMGLKESSGDQYIEPDPPVSQFLQRRLISMQSKSSCLYSFDRLYPDRLWDKGLLTNKISMSNIELITLRSSYQAIKDSQNYRQKIGLALDRWDTQDLRPDINWTAIYNFEQKSSEDFEVIYNHSRYLVFQNVGQTNLKIKKIFIDTDEYQCANENGLLLVRNCRSLMKREFAPLENITLDLLISPEFKDLNTFHFVNSFKLLKDLIYYGEINKKEKEELEEKKRIILTLETEFFVQKFQIEIQYPSIAANIVEKIKQAQSTYLKETSFFNKILLICMIYSSGTYALQIIQTIIGWLFSTNSNQELQEAGQEVSKKEIRNQVAKNKLLGKDKVKKTQQMIKDEQKIFFNSNTTVKKNEKQQNEHNQQNLQMNLNGNNQNQSILVDQINKFSKDSQKIYNKSEEILQIQEEKIRKQIPFLKMQFTDQLASLGYSQIRNFFNVCKYSFIRNALPDTGEIFFKTGLLIKENILPSKKELNKPGQDKQNTNQVSAHKKNFPQVFNEAMKVQNQLYPTSRLLEEFIDVQKRFDEDPQRFEASILSAHNTQNQINLFAPYYLVKKQEQALGQILHQTIMQINEANQKKQQEMIQIIDKKNPEITENIPLTKSSPKSKVKQAEKKFEMNQPTTPIVSKNKLNQQVEESQSKNKQEPLNNQEVKQVELIIQEEKKQEIQQKPVAQQKQQKKPKKDKINIDQPAAKPTVAREKTPEQQKQQKNENLTEEEKTPADNSLLESAEKTGLRKGMIKKVNKKDQKKIEARKKQELQLAENARRLEQQMAEQALKIQQSTPIVKSSSPVRVKEQSQEFLIFRSNSQKSITILSYHSSSDAQQPQNKRNKNKQKNQQNAQLSNNIQFKKEEFTNLNEENTLINQPLIQDKQIIVKTDEENQQQQFENRSLNLMQSNEKKTNSLKNPQSIIDEEFDLKLSFEKLDNSILNEPYDSSPKSEGELKNSSPKQNLIYQAKRKVYEKGRDFDDNIINKSVENFEKQTSDQRKTWDKSLQNDALDNKKYESAQNTQTLKQEFSRTITTKQRLDPLPITKQVSSNQLFKEKLKYSEPKYPARKYQETSIIWAENKQTYQQQDIRSKDEYRYDDEEEGLTRGRDPQWRDYEELPYDSKDTRRRQLGRIEPQRTIDLYDTRRKQQYEYDEYEDEENDRSLEKQSYGLHDDFYPNEIDKKNIQMYRQPYNITSGQSYAVGRYNKNDEIQNLVKQGLRSKPTGPLRQVYETNYDKEIKGVYPQYQPYTQRYAGINPLPIRGKIQGFNPYYSRGGVANYNYRAKIDQQYYYENHTHDDYNDEEDHEKFNTEQHHYSTKLTPGQQADSQRVRGIGFDSSARGTNFRVNEPSNYQNQTQSLQNQRINQKTAIKREAAKNIRLRCQNQEQNESQRKGFGLDINESSFLQPIFKEDSIKRGRRQQSQSLTKNSNINQKQLKAHEIQARMSKYQIVPKNKPITSNESESDSESQFKNADSYYEESNPSQSYTKTKKFEKVIEIIKSKKNSETKDYDHQTTSQKVVSKKDFHVNREINQIEPRVTKDKPVEHPEVTTEYQPYIRKEYKPIRQLQPDLNTKLFKFIRKYKPKETEQKEIEIAPDVKEPEPVPVQEPEKKPQKSFYETYINVSSIFSDQFLTFGNSRQNNVKEDEEDEWIKPKEEEQIVENKSKAYNFSFAQFNNNQALPYSLFGDHQSRQREVSRFSRFLKGHEHEDEEAEEERHSIFNLGSQHNLR